METSCRWTGRPRRAYARLLAASIIMLVVLPSRLRAHAHIFIDYTIQAVFDEGQLQGFRATWTFDRMFSAFIVKQFDSDKNGKFDDKETANVYRNSFMNLKKNNFFTYVKIDHDDVPVPIPTGFECELLTDEEVIRYAFFLPIPVDVGTDKRRVSVFFFDPVIYVSFTVMKDDVTVSNSDPTLETDAGLRRIKYTNRPTFTFRKGG